MVSDVLWDYSDYISKSGGILGFDSVLTITFFSIYFIGFSIYFYLGFNF